MEQVRGTTLYRQFEADHPGVEVWADPDPADDGWTYFTIVSCNQGLVRILARVRTKPGQFESRGYDANGDDMWVHAY